jgi:hypothetical protein
MTLPKVFNIAPQLIKNTQEQLRVHTSHKAISIVIMQYVKVRSKRITFFFAKTKFKSRVFLRQTWSNKLSNSNFQAILHKLSKRSPRDNAKRLTFSKYYGTFHLTQCCSLHETIHCSCHETRPKYCTRSPIESLDQ